MATTIGSKSGKHHFQMLGVTDVVKLGSMKTIDEMRGVQKFDLIYNALPYTVNPNITGLETSGADLITTDCSFLQQQLSNNGWIKSVNLPWSGSPWTYR